MYTFNREEYEKRIQWYKDARFGMFIHWGLYAIPARGEWMRHFEEMPSDEYDKYMDEFTAKDCDIRQWVHLAKEAGMKYVVYILLHNRLETSRLSSLRRRDPPDEEQQKRNK